MFNSQVVDIHTSIASPLLRSWQISSQLNMNDFMYPIFLKHNPDTLEEIPNMKGQLRIGSNHLINFLSPLVSKGLKCVLIFGICNPELKDERGSDADSVRGPVIQGVQMIRKHFPALTIGCDVCICAYTSHSHCGILDKEGRIDNELSVKRLVEISLAYANAGCHIIAPSSCMDGKIKAIKTALNNSNYKGRVSLMSYSAKFASSFFGPFRSANQSDIEVADRKCYQLPPGGKGLAMRTVDRDIQEGADIVMIKPGLPYLDIIQAVKTKYPDYPVAVYQVSGEFAMLNYAAENGALDFKRGVLETMHSFKRSGASIIITYLVPYLLDLDEQDLSNYQ